MALHDYEWYVSEYENQYHSLLEKATEHPSWLTWARFYWDAKKWASSVHHDLGWEPVFALRKFTACIAALSPMKPWDLNKQLAVLALTDFMETGTCDNVPVMGSRKSAARIALTLGIATGPKVEPFARALYGDRRAAVIDRHMMDAITAEAPYCDPPPQTHLPHLIEALTRVTDTWRKEGWLEPQYNVAEVQAGLWGYIREVIKGLQPHERILKP